MCSHSGLLVKLSFKIFLVCVSVCLCVCVRVRMYVRQCIWANTGCSALSPTSNIDKDSTVWMRSMNINCLCRQSNCTADGIIFLYYLFLLTYNNYYLNVYRIVVAALLIIIYSVFCLFVCLFFCQSDEIGAINACLFFTSSTYSHNVCKTQHKPIRVSKMKVNVKL